MEALHVCESREASFFVVHSDMCLRMSRGIVKKRAGRDEPALVFDFEKMVSLGGSPLLPHGIVSTFCRGGIGSHNITWQSGFFALAIHSTAMQGRQVVVLMEVRYLKKI